MHAVRRATAAYGDCDVKNQRRCNDLLREISFLQNEAGSLSDEADRLEDDAERLKRDATIDLAISAIAALSFFGGAARGLRVAWRVIQRKNSRRLTRDDIFDLLTALGAFGVAIASLKAITELREAEELSRKAEALERNSDRLARGLREALEEYAQAGCGQTDGLTS